MVTSWPNKLHFLEVPVRVFSVMSMRYVMVARFFFVAGSRIETL